MTQDGQGFGRTSGAACSAVSPHPEFLPPIAAWALVAAILAGATAGGHTQGIAPSPDAGLQAYNGVWATSPAVCTRYARHLADAKGLDGALDFVAPSRQGAYLVTTRGIRFLDEASTQCRLAGLTERARSTSATLSCSNAVNPDVTDVVLDIVKSATAPRFTWKPRFGAARDGRVHRCLSAVELGQAVARLWSFDPSTCAVTAAHSQGRVTFAKDPADGLTLTLSGDVARDHKGDFAASLFVDRAPPIVAAAKAGPEGIVVALGPLDARAPLIAEGFLLSIATEEAAARGSGTYNIPVLELPLLGSGRAMGFLRQCRREGAAAQPATAPQDVAGFLRSFVDELDRELPGHRHETPEHALIDLDDDGRSDLVLRPVSPVLCGSGGCTLLVYRATPDGRFEKVYEKQSPDENFPSVGPAAKDGHRTLSFPYHAIGEGRVLYEVAEWQGDRYSLSHYADGDIRIVPLAAPDGRPTDSDGVLRERPSAAARALDQQGLGSPLGTTVNDEGRWMIAKACNGCPYGYARLRP